MKSLFSELNKDLCEKHRLICLSVLFALVFWVFESFLHYYVFKTCCFMHAFLLPGPHEIWMRLMVVGMFIVYGIYTQNLLDLRLKTEAEKSLLLGELEQIFQTAGDGMRVIDKDFNVIRRSDTYLALCGRRHQDDWRGKCFEEFPGPLCGSDNCPLERIMHGEKRFKSLKRRLTALMCLVMRRRPLFSRRTADYWVLLKAIRISHL